MTAKTKQSSNQKSSIKAYLRQHLRKVALITGASLFVLYLLGIPQHSYYFVRCGGRLPVTQTSSGALASLAAGYDSGYLISSDEHYYHPPYAWNTNYYCTEQAAVDDGIGPDPFSTSWLHHSDSSMQKSE